MKNRILLTFIGLFLLNLAFGQDTRKYSELIKDAWGLYEAKEFQKSANKYKEAFDVFDGKAYPNDRYNAACSYSLVGNIDTSFYHLFRLANDSEYDNYGHITIDTDLSNLHNDKRWGELLTIVKANKEKAEANLDKELVAIIDTIYQEDQKYRMQLDEIEKKYGRESNEMNALWETINEKDSINLIIIKKILDENGWLGPDIIGRQGNSTLFLVIQHSDLETQLKYLTMMRDAVKKENAVPADLALLEDRVALRQGKRQIYGSQIGRDPETGEYYVSPLTDPENVDKRRAEVGLGTIANYINHWGMTWDINKHKERTSKIEAEKEN